jgi:hypothetical protein
MTIREAIHDESVSYSDFRCFLNESGCGDWDQVNSTDNVRNYCCDMIKQGIAVSHIVAALEQHDLYVDDWKIWLGNSMETPEPISDKEELAEALSLSDEELDGIYGEDEEQTDDEE